VTPEELTTTERLLALEPLARFLAAAGLVGDGPLEAEEIGSGHSNPTYLLTQGDTQLVVRRPPRPPVPPTAHDVLREARVLSGVEGHVPVPRVLAVCSDPSVIGAPFYVMEKMEGSVISRELPDALAGPDDRRRIGEQLVDVLADLHAVDWRRGVLAELGRPTGYLERQLGLFSRLWEVNRTRHLPEVERLGAWLSARRPESAGATVVHGDYRLGNVMFAREPPARIVAVFDWEMATIGDPLADVGYLSAVWVEPDDPPLRMFELGSATRGAGFLSRGEIVARYEERSGRPAAALPWYEVLALWKLAVMMEGNYKRAQAGILEDEYLEGFGEGVVELLQRGSEIATRARP
jgi:aminoglycoside phosphotransferase (APT) family kinase protein